MKSCVGTRLAGPLGCLVAAGALATAGRTPPLDPRILKALEALGYVGAGSRADGADAEPSETGAFDDDGSE